jgi:translocation protein SEC63
LKELYLCLTNIIL